MDETIFIWVVFAIILSGIEALAIIIAIKIAKDSLEEKAREIKAFIKMKDTPKEDVLKEIGL